MLVPSRCARHGSIHGVYRVHMSCARAGVLKRTCARVQLAAHSGTADQYAASLLKPPIATQKLQETAAYLEMARCINVVPSLLLVLVGGWAAAQHAPAALVCWPVAAAAASSAGVAVASVVVNDYFDFTSGVDKLNAPDKPLPAGVVPPDGALLFSFVIYMAVLVAACLLESAPLRAVIAASAMLTLLYTPMLKRLFFMKNLVVATIIAASPIAGALAVGTGSAGVFRVLAPCAFVFLGVLVREVLMDISDTEGDRAVGVNTLPVVLGRRGALAVTGICLAAAACMAGWVAANSVVATKMAGLLGLMPAQLLAAGVAAAALLPLARSLWDVWHTDFDKDVISTAVDGSLKPIGLGMIILAALAT